jgi:hypothetical protein
MRKLIGVFAVLLFIAGCQTPNYQVRDPNTGRTYYTKKIVRKPSGAVTLTDGVTGDTVTLQNSEVSEITEQQYNNAIRGTGR